jgi:hypothetical protein
MGAYVGPLALIILALIVIYALWAIACKHEEPIVKESINTNHRKPIRHHHVPHIEGAGRPCVPEVNLSTLSEKEQRLLIELRRNN